jgi:hypothetical protein
MAADMAVDMAVVMVADTLVADISGHTDRAHGSWLDLDPPYTSGMDFTGAHSACVDTGGISGMAVGGIMALVRAGYGPTITASTCGSATKILERHFGALNCGRRSHNGTKFVPVQFAPLEPPRAVPPAPGPICVEQLFCHLKEGWSRPNPALDKRLRQPVRHHPAYPRRRTRHVRFHSHRIACRSAADRRQPDRRFASPSRSQPCSFFAVSAILRPW